MTMGFEAFLLEDKKRLSYIVNTMAADGMEM